MKCVYCGHSESKVVDSRPLDEGSSTRRRRECLECHRRFTTYEKPEHDTTMVIKKDNRREPFDPEKVRRGIMKACEKRDISMDQIESLVLAVEREVDNDVRTEVPVDFIGELVMEELKRTDEVAYVRFASVYREFKDVDTFMDELRKLME